VVVAVFTPGLRENATLLRLVRLARIVRVVRLLPDLRVLVTAVARSLPGVASLAIMTVLLIYLYGMLGWVLFGDEIAGYRNIGEAMLTMFVVLSLENLPTYIDEGRAVTGWAIPFYVSYALLAAFLVFNFFIGVIVNSMEEAHEIEAERDAQWRAEHGEAPVGPTPERQIAAMREMLDGLERDLARQPRQPPVSPL
jgi:voltage-gated sodium channel